MEKVKKKTRKNYSFLFHRNVCEKPATPEIFQKCARIFFDKMRGNKITRSISLLTSRLRGIFKVMAAIAHIFAIFVH